MGQIIRACLIFSLVSFLSVLGAEFFLRMFSPQETGAIFRIPAPQEQAFPVNLPSGAVKHSFNNYSGTYFTNTMGLRSDEEINQKKLNVILLGDSFTFGLFLKQDQTLTHFITGFMPNSVQVMNGAVAGTGVAEWLAFTDDYAHELCPDLLIWMIKKLAVTSPPL